MNQTIRNSHGERLDYSFEKATTSRQDGWLVVLGHGVTGNKDRPLIAATARALNAAGFDTLRFSFSGNGESEGKFTQATLSKEVGDLGSVIDAASSSYPHIAYAGHSMGAAVGVIRASRDPRIAALVSIAGMVDTKAFAQAEFGDEIPEQGVMWEKESCPLSSAFMEDLCQTVQNVGPQAKAISIPWLLLHGTADDVVLPQDTKTIAALGKDSTQIVYIDDASHIFEEPEHESQLTSHIVAWLKALAKKS